MGECVDWMPALAALLSVCSLCLDSQVISEEEIRVLKREAKVFTSASSEVLNSWEADQTLVRDYLTPWVLAL